MGVIAEVSYEALKKRHDQGWVKEIIDDADKLLARLKEAKRRKEASSTCYPTEGTGWPSTS